MQAGFILMVLYDESGNPFNYNPGDPPLIPDSGPLGDAAVFGFDAQGNKVYAVDLPDGYSQGATNAVYAENLANDINDAEQQTADMLGRDLTTNEQLVISDAVRNSHGVASSVSAPLPGLSDEVVAAWRAVAGNFKKDIVAGVANTTAAVGNAVGSVVGAVANVAGNGIGGLFKGLFSSSGGLIILAIIAGGIYLLSQPAGRKIAGKAVKAAL
jgi:hypothetical protein